MDVFEHSNDYREPLRARLRELGKVKKAFTLKRVAAKIPLQYTYLSRALNHPATHLQDDAFFRLCQCLEFFPEEVDYLILLRSHSMANDPGRRAYLQNRLEQMRRARKLNADVRQFNAGQLGREMDYLLDPLAVLVHAALNIEAFRSAPRRLAQALGLAMDKLTEILRTLDQLGFIELDTGRGAVSQVLNKRLHYGTHHPFMRVHQQLLRNMSTAQVLKAPETEKHVFMATFASDAASFDKIKAKFQAFVAEAQKIAVAAPAEQLYQLNFELFKWV